MPLKTEQVHFSIHFRVQVLTNKEQELYLNIFNIFQQHLLTYNSLFPLGKLVAAAATTPTPKFIPQLPFDCAGWGVLFYGFFQ